MGGNPAILSVGKLEVLFIGGNPLSKAGSCATEVVGGNPALSIGGNTAVLSGGKAEVFPIGGNPLSIAGSCATEVVGGNPVSSIGGNAAVLSGGKAEVSPIGGNPLSIAGSCATEVVGDNPVLSIGGNAAVLSGGKAEVFPMGGNPLSTAGSCATCGTPVFTAGGRLLSIEGGNADCGSTGKPGSVGLPCKGGKEEPGLGAATPGKLGAEESTPGTDGKPFAELSIGTNGAEVAEVLPGSVGSPESGVIGMDCVEASPIAGKDGGAIELSIGKFGGTEGLEAPGKAGIELSVPIGGSGADIELSEVKGGKAELLSELPGKAGNSLPAEDAFGNTGIELSCVGKAALPCEPVSSIGRGGRPELFVAAAPFSDTDGALALAVAALSPGNGGKAA